MTTNLAHSNRNDRSVCRLIAALVLMLGTTTLTRIDPVAASATFTDVPAIAGFVAGATGYSHPTSWPPQSCAEPTAIEAFVGAQTGMLALC